jgi:hypothetical protein
MSDENHMREDILAFKASYDAMRNLYLDRCEQCGVDRLPCLECDDPDSSAAIKEIIQRTHNTRLLPECCCRRREYFAKKKATELRQADTKAPRARTQTPPHDHHGVSAEHQDSPKAERPDTQATKTKGMRGYVQYHVRRFTAEDVETIRRDWGAYIPLQVTAQKLDRTFGTLRQKVRDLGLRRRSNVVLKCFQWAPEHLKSRRALLSDEDFIAACKHWREQEQQKTAAKKAEDRLQIARTISQRTDLDRRTKMKLMREAGASFKEVGQCFGVTRQRVQQITATEPKPPKPKLVGEPTARSAAAA